MIDLYMWSTTNGRRASVMLEEVGLPYQAIATNIHEGEQRTPEHTARNPYQKVPVPPDVLVLPAHDEPFFGLHARLDALIGHHGERLERLEQALAEPRRVSETLDVLYRRELRAHEIDLGFAESLAHLNCLIEQGRVSRMTGDDGVWQYRRIQLAMPSLGA